MVQLLTNYLSQEFLTLLPIVCLVFVIFIDRFNSKYKKALLFVILSLISIFSITTFVEVSIANMDIEAINNPALISLRFVCSNILYMLRPMLLGFICIYFTNIEAKLQILMLIPSMICTLEFIINLIHPIVFTVSNTNHHTSLGIINLSHVMVIIYMVLFLVFALIEVQKATLAEIISVAIVAVTIITGLIIDYVYVGSSLAHAIVIAFSMYYLIVLLSHSNQTIDQHELELENRKNSLMISQIQSHFVFNTLNTIYALASYDVESARELLLKFSAYLKDNINFSKQEEPFITIEQELEHTRIYSDIEAVRFPKVKVEYEINDSDYFIPPITIQPMVENAIKHGVNGPKGGTVSVVLYKEDNNHIIIIKDNGKGIATKSDSKHHTGIGLSNVKARIEELCNGSFSIEMVENVGTTVTIKIPVEQSK